MGRIDIPELPVGTYTVSAEAQGFKKFVANTVVVSIGHVTVVDIALQVGGSTDTVTVEANAVQVETTSTQLGAVMTDTRDARTAAQHAQHISAIAAPTGRAIAAGRGPILRQRAMRASFPLMAGAADRTTIW